MKIEVLQNTKVKGHGIVKAGDQDLPDAIAKKLVEDGQALEGHSRKMPAKKASTAKGKAPAAGADAQGGADK